MPPGGGGGGASAGVEANDGAGDEVLPASGPVAEPAA
jgi:hypothetical protein